jgi:hypothetical protein
MAAPMVTAILDGAGGGALGDGCLGTCVPAGGFGDAGNWRGGGAGP